MTLLHWTVHPNLCFLVTWPSWRPWGHNIIPACDHLTLHSTAPQVNIPSVWRKESSEHITKKEEKKKKTLYNLKKALTQVLQQLKITVLPVVYPSLVILMWRIPFHTSEWKQTKSQWIISCRIKTALPSTCEKSVIYW